MIYYIFILINIHLRILIYFFCLIIIIKRQKLNYELNTYFYNDLNIEFF